MTDFLTRLAERTLGLIPVAQPAIASMFAPGLPMAGTATETDILDAPGELQVVSVPRHGPKDQGNREVDTAMFPPPAQEMRRPNPKLQPC
jgi:hypothetical protein